MNRFTRNTIVTAILLVFVGASVDAAITKVARRMNSLSFFGGYATAQGEISGMVVDDFIIDGRYLKTDASEGYEPTFYFGLSYGQLRNEFVHYSVGFRFTHHNIADTVNIPGDYFFTWVNLDEKPSYNQYDLDFNLNIYGANPTKATFAPYAGVGLHAGIMAVTEKGFESLNEVTTALSLNFGADLAISKTNKGRKVMSLVSANSYNVLASGDRPKYLNLGAALRFWFKQ